MVNSMAKVMKLDETGNAIGNAIGNPCGHAHAHPSSAFTWSPEQQQALDAFNRGENVFLTGPGGSGKTALIKEMVRQAENPQTFFKIKKRVQVCALTGCAAVLLDCNARTLHSWAGLGLGNGTLTEIVQRIQDKRKKNNWRFVDVLIVDEVSMMSKKLFDTINYLAKHFRNVLDQPFGGLQVVFVGDFYQLPPVGQTPDEQAFCFESEDWSTTFHTIVQLQRIFRQDDDTYTSILNGIREGRLTSSAFSVLKAQVSKDVSTLPFRPTRLMARRTDVEAINRVEMAQLPAETERTFKARRAIIPLTAKQRLKVGFTTDEQQRQEYQNLLNNIMAEAVLTLREGAHVMCVANKMDPIDESPIVVNGSQGVVVGFDAEGYPIVDFIKGPKMAMQPHVWQHQNERFADVGVEQIPLIPAWAITIHKAQGVTLEQAEIDVGDGIFECGQTYVALSRVKSLEGLYLTGLNPQRIRVNKKVQAFYKSLAEQQA